MEMIEIEKIAKFIEDNSSKIIENIEFESVTRYNFLKYQFYASDVEKNRMFQVLYWEFYKSDKVGLTPEFKKEYFAIMEEYRYLRDFDFSDVLQRLYEIPTSEGLKTFHFSITTKMLNMINEDMPVYNDEVLKIFDFVQPEISSFDEKLKIYLNQYEIIRKTYRKIANKFLIPKTNACFNEKFKKHNKDDVNKLDFIFWSAGKLKK